MISETADSFVFSSTTGDSAENRSTASGGGAGKASLGDLTFSKYTDFLDDIDDLNGSTGGGGAKIPLLLPAVQSAREAAGPTNETALDELSAFPSSEAWDDWIIG